ncbi:MAG: hypothetical protein CMJ83_11760 [Planctomycetes bacterium]|nr:hypothetical protein [Planctomycetota bacterium]
MAVGHREVDLRPVHAGSDAVRVLDDLGAEVDERIVASCDGSGDVLALAVQVGESTVGDRSIVSSAEDIGVTPGSSPIRRSGGR